VSLPILTTKLFTPPSRPNLVPRTRLIEQLNNGLHQKLTLISAPAGFGKTTLLSSWVAQIDSAYSAWLSLEKADNDLSRFLTYFVAALQLVERKIGTGVQASLQSPGNPNTELILTTLINEIAEFRDDLVLILDDYHVIESKPTNHALTFLLDHLPANMHLVIATRVDPPFPLARLRARKQMTELRTADLRFTQEETTAFLNQVMKLGLSEDDIVSLETRTEGWIVGLQLAALSLQEKENANEFIQTFTGSHHYILDYLVEEVLNRQPPETQSFLLQTSILERLTGELCDAVCVDGTDQSNGQETLEQLARANLFIMPLDDKRHWYRYHHLFSDLLKQRLHEKEQDHIPELHHRASQWYETEGFVDEAIQHAIAAGYLENAIRLLERIGTDLILNRESNKLVKYVEQLPDDQFQDYPLLCVLYAWAVSFRGQLEAVEPILRMADDNIDKAPGIPILGYMTTVRSYVVNQLGDNHKAVKLAEQALEEMSNASPNRITLKFRGAIVIWLGVNYRKLGDLEKARKLCIKAASLNEDAGNSYPALAAMHQLADLAAIQGQPHQAVEFCQQGFQMARRFSEEKGERVSTLVASGGLHLRLGTVLYQRNDLIGAAPHIQRAVDLLESGEELGRVHSYRMLAYLKQAEGDYESSYDYLLKAYAVKDKISIYQTNISILPSLEQLGIMLSKVNPDMAHLSTDIVQRVKTQGIQPDDDVDFTSPSGYSQELEYSNLARALISENRISETLPLVERLLEATRLMGRKGDEIHHLILITLVYHALGEIPIALEYLSEALTLAEPQGYVRIFVDEGLPMEALLREAAKHGAAPNYVSQLLSAFGKAEGRTPVTQLLIEPLSKREFEVLRLLGTELNGPEIARELMVSLHTIRTHTQNIYNKLGVNNRRAAVHRAVELDLL